VRTYLRVRRKHDLQRESSADLGALYTANEQPSRTDVAGKSRFLHERSALISPLEKQRKAQLVSHCPSSFHRPWASEQPGIALRVRNLEGSVIHDHFGFNLLHRAALSPETAKFHCGKVIYPSSLLPQKVKGYSRECNLPRLLVKYDRLCTM
jgi:hypothetical protein